MYINGNIDLHAGQITNFAFEQLASPPVDTFPGRIYQDTTTDQLFMRDALDTGWIDVTSTIPYTAGDGIDLGSNIISVVLDTNPGLQFNTGTLKVKAAGLLAVDSSGVYLTANSITNAYISASAAISASKIEDKFLRNDGDDTTTGSLTIDQTLTSGGGLLTADNVLRTVVINGVGMESIGSIVAKGGIFCDVIDTPAAPTITNQGTPGVITWSYKITALSVVGETLPSPVGTTLTGNATLDGTNYNTITWVLTEGALAYNIYRTAANGTPGTIGLIGTIASLSPLSFDDTGLAVTTAIPIVDTSAGLTDSSTGVPTVMTVTGGIITAMTKTTPAVNGTYLNPTSITIVNGIITAIS